MADGSSLQSWIDAGVFDSEAEGADRLREVLEFYDSIGINPAGYVGVDPSDLMYSINMRILQPGPRYSAAEACRSAGLNAPTFERLCRSAGYALDGEFTDLDVQGFKSFANASPLFSEDAINDFVRMLAGAMSRVADATTSLWRVDVASEIEAAGGTEIDYARKNQASAALVEPLFSAMKAFFFNQLAGATRLGDEGRRAVTSDSITTIHVAVGFVDIVGYTRLSASLAPDELARFISDFEARAAGLVADHGGRLAKMIGDAVMFVAVEPTRAVDIAGAMLETFGGTTAQPRGGVAYGEVIALGGDYYGEVVNLASRIADQAVPGELLVDQATVLAVPTQSFETAGRRQIKGLDDPVPLFSLQGRT